MSAVRKGIGGVYVLKNDYGDVLYVGQSENFRNRLADHMRGDGYSAVFSNQISKIDLYTIKEGYEREIYETFMIRELTPKYNRGKVFDDYDERRANILEEIESLEQERHDLKSRIMEYECVDDLDDIEDYFEYFTDEDYARRFMLGEDLLQITETEDSKRRIAEITSKIRYLYEKLS
ncbi:GIY-YIG nuclease family protein [Bacillus cereus]|uniref:GIY-YIG nuclease family protein n=1 Tax=Bacillus cereus TaxID=1396 RepID=UPI001D0E96BA|nr:GIY-YIG nuclease family protein [Bacillus cereus]MCC2383537.1 GIY-YIG nuclease family protein [Bacillus cereus]